MSESLVKGFKSKKAAFEFAGSSMTAAVRKVIVSKASAFDNAGKMLGGKLVSGLSSKSKTAVRTMTSILNTCVTSIRSQYTAFYSGGAYLVDGFVAGMNDNSFKATLCAATMASDALKAAKKTLGIHSPSKEFYKVGYFANKGFVNALADGIKLSYNGGSRIADSAKKGLSDAISKVADVVNGDVDMQPTIRPVLDLSDVKSGAGSISRMFNGGASIGLRSNINAISNMMNQNSQNGDTSEIVSAIDKLREDIGNMSQPSYNVNGVTYDDGSNVSNAVEDLIRAARIERRR